MISMCLRMPCAHVEAGALARRRVVDVGEIAAPANSQGFAPIMMRDAQGCQMVRAFMGSLPVAHCAGFCAGPMPIFA